MSEKRYSRIKKLITFILLGIIMVSCISGCGNKKEEQKEEQVKDKKIQIGICFDSFLIERWERDRDVFVSTAKELGADVNVQNANGSVDEQIAKIEYLIDKKVDVIVIVCVDANALKDVVKKAKDNGIVVIAYDRMLLNSDADLYISFDNEKVGRMMGEAIVDSNPDKKRVLMLTGPHTDNNVSMLNKGFEDVMSANHYQIVDQMYADGWKPEYASDYIYNHPDILNDVSCIMCGNDNIASHVVRVLAEKRLAGKILVTGQDADLEACQRIVEGTQLMTVFKPVEMEARTAAECAVALAKGEEIQGINASISDGTNMINSIVLDPVSVDKFNMDETVIKNGFHLREEVYLNIATK